MPRPADRRARTELLRAAEAVFAEHGLAAARVEDITARAGVSKGAFYLHFQSKEDCWRQIIEGFLTRLADHLEELSTHIHGEQQSAASLIEAWRRHDVAVLDFCWQNRALMRMVLAGGGAAPYAYLIDEFAERAKRQLEVGLRRALAAGLYRDDIDPAVVAALLSGAYDRLARELIKEPQRPDIEAWCGQAIDVFTRGLLRDDARASRPTPRAKGRAPGAAGKGM